MNKIKLNRTILVMFLLFFGVNTPSLAKADEKTDMKKIKDNYIIYLIGEESLNNESINKEKISNISQNAKNAIEKYEIKDGSIIDGQILNSNNLTEAELSQNLHSTYQQIYNMALAYATPGEENELYHDVALKDKVLAAITWLNDNYYGKHDTGYYGNWYHWQIGIPQSLTKIMLLLEDEITDYSVDFITNSIATMDQYLRDGKNGDVDLTSRVYTGANLADVTFNRIIQGALMEKPERIDKAVSDLITVFDTIDPDNIKNGVTDGYYADGSILQHSSVAYTGSYGKVLLGKIAQSVTVLDGTRWQDDSLLDTVQEWIYSGFSPVIYEGYMMEIVKGRAVSRDTTGYQDSSAIVESLVELSHGFSEDNKSKLQSHIKYITSDLPEKINTASFNSVQNINEYNRIINNDDIKSENALSNEAHYAFNLMDKTVHIRDDYAFAISKSSNRISKYEYMSGENMRSWFQGDGAFYLYLAGTDHNKEYGSDFFTTVNQYRLPGTTTPNEERETISELYGKQFYENLDEDFYASSEKQNLYVYFPLGTNHYSGGVKLDKYGISAMKLGDESSYQDKKEGLLPDEFVTYKNADANKSWFMFDNEIVALGSDIKDELDRDMTTTIDNRMFDADDTVTTSSSFDSIENGTYSKLDSITFSSEDTKKSVSYVFLDDNDVNVNVENRSQNQSYIREQSSKDISKQFATLTIDHKGDEVSKYAYIILPNSDDAAAQTLLKNNPIEVLALEKGFHAVSHTDLNLVGYTSFDEETHKVDDLETVSQMMIMRENNHFAVTDPTNEQKSVEFHLEGNYGTENEKIECSYSDGVTTFVVNTDSLNGATVEFDVEDNTSNALSNKKTNFNTTWIIIGILLIVVSFSFYFIKREKSKKSK